MRIQIRIAVTSYFSETVRNKISEKIDKGVSS